MRVLTTILLLALCSGITFGLPTPKCQLGVGLTDPNNPEPYGVAAPGECTPCAIQGCASCDDNYKQCAACSPAYGATKMINLTDAYGNLQPESCAPCPSGCGACSLDATVCVAEITNCPATTPKAATAAKKNAWDKTGYCTNPPGVTGNGYVSTFTGLVENGVCINCNDSTPNDYKKGAVEGFQARIPPFCDMLSTALDVAANAFPGCPSPQLTLNQTCHSSRSGIPGTWAMYWVFNGSCGGSNMQVAVNGGWETSFPSPPSTAVPEAAGAPAPDYATSSDYAPAPAPTTAPGPSSGSADYTDYADSMIKTPTPVSQWTWASEALPSAGPAAAPTGPAPVPAVAPAPVPEVANVTAVPPPMAPAPASAGSVAGHIGAALMAMVGVVAAF